eukprot:TRINITY_DN5525_c0_g1_i3.p1 TRINITY_DN5525_c0_g1~~TRINITY_DN5525_c0_g1_i3.p1  ORF type:complete len:184 (-),score=12.53 TRINITY_DN5525_c0_g1_i3:245-796(-)
MCIRDRCVDCGGGDSSEPEPACQDSGGLYCDENEVLTFDPTDGYLCVDCGGNSSNHPCVNQTGHFFCQPGFNLSTRPEVDPCFGVNITTNESLCTALNTSCPPWNDHVDPQFEACHVRAQTQNGTCATWCHNHNMTCVHAQDNVDGSCELDPRHTRQTIANNGCHQSWAEQVCGCVPMCVRVP